uniref:Uncharacterized protein n=1 Tax=Micrurus carvalhoi TaxID=3147026 RepID=A0A2H6MX39_9SAUR
MGDDIPDISITSVREKEENCWGALMYVLSRPCYLLEKPLLHNQVKLDSLQTALLDFYLNHSQPLLLLISLIGHIKIQNKTFRRKHKAIENVKVKLQPIKKDK